MSRHLQKGGHLDRGGIAARLRGLIGGQERGDLGAVAARLGVDEVSLRMSVDTLAPYPTLDVLGAVIAAYGVDPNWLLTGDYRLATHRSTAEIEPDRVQAALQEILSAMHEQPRPPQSTTSLRLVKDA